MPRARMLLRGTPLLLTALLCAHPHHAFGRPQPGDVYREYFFRGQDAVPGKDVVWQVVAVSGWTVWQWDQPLAGGVDKDLAVKAEVELHKVTFMKLRGLQLRVNGGPWRAIPDPPLPFTTNLFHVPESYFATIPIPLSEIVAGGNSFNIMADTAYWVPLDGIDPPTVHLWMAYFPTILLRVYYEPASKPHATGAVTSPTSGASLSLEQPLSVQISGAPAAVRRVDYVGYYTDVSTCGDDIWRRWHYNYIYQTLGNNLGTGTQSPSFPATWRTHYVPDQPQKMRIAALITGVDSVIYFSQPVDSLSLNRTGWSAELCTPSGVPQRWSIFAGSLGCTYTVSGNTANLHDAQIAFSNFEGIDSRDFLVNDQPLSPPLCFTNGWEAQFHRERIAPLSLLRTGENALRNVQYSFGGSSVIMWPGPALLLRYGNAPDTVDKTVGPVVTATPRVMPLGNSITAGSSDTTTYRYWLDGLLHQKGTAFDFVGTQHSSSSTGWDSDHESVVGYEVHWMLNRLTSALRQTKPDIVLLHMGTNDILRETGTNAEKAERTVGELSAMIDTMFSQNPSMIILLATLIPTLDTAANPGVQMLNSKLGRLARGSPTAPYGSVKIVNVGASVAPDKSQMRDAWHPNAVGAMNMARVWCDTLEPILRGFKRPVNAAGPPAPCVSQGRGMDLTSANQTVRLAGGRDGVFRLIDIRGREVMRSPIQGARTMSLKRVCAGYYVARVERPGPAGEPTRGGRAVPLVLP